MLVTKPKIGDLVKHADWRLSPVPSYKDEVGLVVKYDKNAASFVEVIWLPVKRGGQCKTFHSLEALEVYNGI